jgi:hypothetical protein
MRRLHAYGFTLAVVTLGMAVPGSADAAEDGVIHLFNGKDLKGFYKHLCAQPSGKEPYGKNKDPNKVISVVDGAIRVSGEDWGCFTTVKDYENYHLVVEFKWGDLTFKSREKASRDSGILLHCTGSDGGFGPWMESYECQMIEGGTGDFLVLSGKTTKRSLTVESENRGGQWYSTPGASPIAMESGRFNWYGRDPNWKDVKGFRGEQDVEKPVGEWNRLECICAGDTITNILNGKVVNKASNATVTKGKILFQSEGAEVFFRNLMLYPLR